MPRRVTPGYVRVLAKTTIDSPTGCWVFEGAKSSNGYGHVSVTVAPSRQTYPHAHRVVYEALVGPIPDGLVLDHLCRNPPCVNPSHLEPVTSAVNTRRGAPATATACIHGHQFTPENTYRSPTRGRRQCRTCRRAVQQRRRDAA
jgi:hypothetical protein